MNLFNSRVLMCHPTHYGIDYEINPWMSVNNKVNKKLAIEQWCNLHHLIIRCGGYVHYIDPEPSLPDMVFTANAGFPYGNKIWISKFKYDQRKNEEIFFTEFFLRNGFSVGTFTNYSYSFEGMGDILQMGKIIWCGWGFRSDKRIKEFLAKEIKDGFDFIDVKLIDPNFYHLDTCFCPLDDTNALIYSNAFAAFPKFYNLNFIEVPKDEAVNFACNAVVLGKHVILPDGSDRTCSKLEDLGFIPHQTPMSEFIKSGGACKCLTLKF